MAVTVERLIATLEARIDKYEKNLQKAYGQTDRQFTRIEKRGKVMEQRMAAVNSRVGRTFSTIFAGAVSVRGAQRLVDAATRIDNALKVAGLSGEELEKTYRSLMDSALKNAAPLEALVELYGRVALVQKELGISSEQLRAFTDNIALALRVSGKSTAESSGALLQLSQALGSGVVRSQEFNSMLDGALPIVQAAAAGIEEAGGSVAKLRQLVVDGKVSSEAFFKGFEAGAYTLKEKVAGATYTVSQRFENFQTTLINTAREFNKNSDAAALVGRELDDLAGFITDVANAMIAGQQWLDQYTGKLGDLGTAAWNAGEALRDFLGLPNLGETLGINDWLGTGGKKPGTSEGDGPTDIGTVTKPGTISLADYQTKPDGDKKGRGSKRSPAERFQSDIVQIKERTEAIRSETAALAGLNPLVDDYGYAVAKAGAQQDLLTAAKRAGLEITPKLKASIESLAEGYASAEVEAAKLAESQDEIRRRAEDMRDLGRDVMGGFIHDMMEGKSAADALASALGKIGDKLLDMAMNSLFDGKTGAFGGAGLFGGKIIPGVLHKGGVAGRDGYGGGRSVSPSAFAGAHRYHDGGTVGKLRPDEVPAILQRGEIVLPKGLAKSTGAGSVVVNFNPVIDNRGASAEAVIRTQQQLDKLKAELPAHVTQAVRKAQKSNVKFG